MKPSKPSRPSRALAPRETAIKPAGDTATLTRAQKHLLAQALARADAARVEAEGALVEFGRWVLVNIFDDDAAAALDDKRANPVWHALLERAGGPTLRLSRKVIYVALQMAAHDKRITDEAWRGLEPGRKELLLPLRDEKLMREAARHVTEMKLSQRATSSYVRALRDQRGGVTRARPIDGPQLLARLERLHVELLVPSRDRLAALVSRLDEAERKRLRVQARALASYAQMLLRQVP